MSHAEISREDLALKQYATAVEEFENSYTKFANANTQYLRVADREVQTAIQLAGSVSDVKRSAELFGDKISATLEASKTKEQTSRTGWRKQLHTFLKCLYPVAQVSIKLTSSLAEVIPVIQYF